MHSKPRALTTSMARVGGTGIESDVSVGVAVSASAASARVRADTSVHRHCTQSASKLLTRGA